VHAPKATKRQQPDPELENTMIQPAREDIADEPSATAETGLEVLWRLASEAQLFRSADGRFHARVKIGGRDEFYALKSAGFRDWLTKAYFADRRQPPSHSSIQRVIAVLEAEARFDGGMPSVAIRVGRDRAGNDSNYFIDLGDPTGRAIWICAEGWLLVDKPDVQFRHPDGLLPLPVPAIDGSIDLLRPYVNVDDNEWPLLVTWLTAALRPVGPHPILVLYGEQGSAKTTLAKVLRLLIDPQDCPIFSEPKSTRDLMVTAVNGWLLSYDNLSILPPWLSDSFCRLVSGGGFAARALYTNEERSVITAQRPVILNGIDEFVRRGDLIDRAVFLHLKTIPHTRRRSEEEFWKAFQAEYSRIFGGVLDAVVGGLSELPTVQLAELPRMADYARWGEAVSRGLGWSPEVFLTTYLGNRRHASAPALEDSIVGSAVLQFATNLDGWSSQMSALYNRLTQFVEQRAAYDFKYDSPAVARKKLAAITARWPKDPRQFSRELRLVTPQLRLHGLFVEFARTMDGTRVVIRYSDPCATKTPKPPPERNGGPGPHENDSLCVNGDTAPRAQSTLLADLDADAIA
jgi:hypothetical protein